MRDKTREAMRLFLGGRCYTAEKLEKDYLAEVANYSNDRWEAPQRASRLAASVKRYKTSEMLRFIFATIAYDPDPDLTPLTVRRLCKALFGRTGSQWLVVEVFGEKGRQHRSADSNPEMVEKMAARYRHAAELHWSATLAEIERVKRLYQTKIKKSKKGTVAKLAMRQPFVLFKGLTFQKLCLPGAFRPGDHHNKMLRPGLCVVHASPQYL
ncbi:hypothetical protein EKA78_23520 [Shigella dysenteriae]|nr:hypothetical protein [Shigella boydii]EFW7621513.1 hypothetical protein [Shigella dysenteriae]EFW7625692.1 hypothetical protein [Shigella dysenteriae]EFX6359175.1 hypothetical protein [Shigella dysenteriae]EFX6363365.1 hypothetical protein [Shigella dysenteriae]